ADRESVPRSIFKHRMRDAPDHTQPAAAVTMGRVRGPKPTPTALRVLRGNPGRRPLNAREPKAAPATLTPPAWLKGLAVAEWQRIAPVLHRLGILTEVDDIALAAYCQTYARWRDSDAKIDEFGPVIKGKGGFPMISPFFTVSLRSLAQMR